MSEGLANAKEINRRRTPEAGRGSESSGPTVEQKRELKQAMVNRQDKVGRALLDEYSKAFKNPDNGFSGGNEAIVAKMWLGAEKLADDVKEPGEANRLLNAMQAMYRQADLGEYVPDVEMPQNASPTEQANAIRRQIEKDYDRVPERVALHTAEGYVEQKHKLNEAEKLLKEAVERGGSSRESRKKIREQAFELKRQRKRLEREEKKMTKRLGKKGQEKYQEAKGESEEFKSDEFKPRPELSNEEKLDQYTNKK